MNSLTKVDGRSRMQQGPKTNDAQRADEARKRAEAAIKAAKAAQEAAKQARLQAEAAKRAEAQASRAREEAEKKAKNPKQTPEQREASKKALAEAQAAEKVAEAKLAQATEKYQAAVGKELETARRAERAKQKANEAAGEAGQKPPYGNNPEMGPNGKSQSSYESAPGRPDMERMMGRTQSANGMGAEYSSDMPMMKRSEMMRSVSI
ncbi:hypothetical protein HUW62_35470 [Myxococcus sp. AM011]|uniref:hypothetical protein n=1 Tax=Myxococcus sp. AM011 TaxID=2745200 RepID=UPI0015959ADF|nr:hypothetical protein [Myxococcus sp. AM011]NVJ26532.1 hypothetical protein [Myxococcus sp. AM011]